jgi:hypothetical protein
MQYASVIFSHESSLYLHGISEREPVLASGEKGHSGSGKKGQSLVG